jgi:dephospho-CoA kinase
MSRGRGGPDAPVLVVAGGTGTGKSTLCRWLAGRGAFVIEADRVGHEVLGRPEIVRALRAEFGDVVLGPEGQPDRRRLGALVFADPAALRRLDRLVHPPLVGEIERRIGDLRRSRAVELIVVDAALHFRFEPRIRCDAVIMGRARPQTRLRRIMERDGLDERQARARLERQRDVDSSEERADAVLSTEEPPEQTRRRLLETVDGLLGTRLLATEPPTAANRFGEQP